MKRLFLLAVAMTIASMSIAAEGKHLSALFSYATFYQSGTGSYVETYLSFDAWNLNFVQSSNGGYQATVEVVITASLGDSMVLAKKYDLASPRHL